MSRIRVAILRGGLSDEYEVSLWTGATVLEFIDRTLFEPIDIIITQQGEWLHNGKAWLPEHIFQSVDVVFNALHGSFGEDGKIQRLMDRYGIPYTGSKSLASSIAMNKVTTKDVLKNTGIKMSPHIHISRNSGVEPGRLAEKIVDMFGPQYVIKPINAGSSSGTMMVKNPALLSQAISDALTHYEEVMVEARIEGREATCGVIERFRDQNIYTLPPVEIIPHNEYFDKEGKYDGTAEEICPARFDYNTKDEIMRLSKTVHEMLNLSQYSRSDFVIAHDGIYFLEVNTLPGLSKKSLFPKALMSVGVSYRDFITHLISDALIQQKRIV